MRICDGAHDGARAVGVVHCGAHGVYNGFCGGKCHRFAQIL